MLEIRNMILYKYWNLGNARCVNFSFLVSVFFILISSFGFAQVTSSIDSTKIRIGEEIIYTINVAADSTDIVLFPEEQTFGPLEMIESYKADTTYEAAKYRLKIGRASCRDRV